jgi:hypothetical protein
LKTDFDISLTLSGVRALIGEITPCIRSVSIEVVNKRILFKCVFDDTSTEHDFELMSAAAAEIIADFPNYEIEEIFITDSFEKIDSLKNQLYHRHESSYWNRS